LIIARHGEELAELLEKRATAHQEAISALRRLLEVTPDMSFSQFEHFTRITLDDHRDIFALSINPYVLAPQRQAFERAMALRSALKGFEIKERDSQRRLVRAAERSDYVPVGLIAPLEGNRAAIGFDIHSDAVRHDAIERARRTAAPALTAPVQLVQDNQKRVGVLLLHPAYDHTSKTAEGGAALMGFAVGVIKVDQMVQIATAAAVIPGIAFRLDDLQAPPGQSLLYSSQALPSLPGTDALWQQDVRVADRSWRLSVFPTPQFQRQHSHWTTVLVGMTGLALAALLQMLLLVSTGKTAIVQRKVHEQTAALHAASEELEDQNAQLHALFRLSPDGFVALAADGRVKFVNPAFLSMTGIDSLAVVGMGEAVLDAELRRRCEVPTAFAGISACFQEVGAALKTQTLELGIPSPRVLQLVGIHSASSSVARILYLRDVTHETEVERLKSEFLSTAAHELRTPMASIFGFAEVLLAQDALDTDAKEMLGIIHRQSTLMASILNELLDLARIEARRGKDFVRAETTLQALVEQVVSEFKLPAGRAAPTLTLSGAPLSVVADHKKMQQAILNVLSNAYKYSPAGGAVQIALLASSSGASEAARVGIRMTDQGIGITPEQLKRVFERFYRADASGKIPGTGLGMSLVQEIVELHGGTVDVASEFGVGTTVTLWLPAARPVSAGEQAFQPRAERFQGGQVA
jgi:signal transduction histidine kinase/CHASE1-domain containing sensor protein